MGYKVFISYSTNDFPIVEHVRRLLANSAVEVFIAEYSVAPGAKLADNIVNAIKNCDLFYCGVEIQRLLSGYHKRSALHGGIKKPFFLLYWKIDCNYQGL